MDEALSRTAYVIHLREAHEKVRDTLKRIEADWPWREGAPPSSGATERTVSELEELRNFLTHHFQEEEMGGGCMEEAVSRLPSLGKEANRIESQHVSLLRELDEIVIELRSDELRPLRSARLHQRFLKFAVALETHEADETRLLNKAFGAGGS